MSTIRPRKQKKLRRERMVKISLYVLGFAVSFLFVFPYIWMFACSFRSTEEILTAPLRLWPEQFDFTAYQDILELGGISLWTYSINSFFYTLTSTLLTVLVTAFGAYALTRKPKLPGFRLLRSGFLLTIMYPYMLLVIPVYLVMYYIGLLGSMWGIILFLSVGSIQFFMFEQFFKSIPAEIIDAAVIDGASETQILFRVVLPIAAPIVGTVTLISFLLNWAQWFPVLVISRTPGTYSLPVALLSMNSELGTNFQGIMALATITTLPVTIVFLLTQRRVMEGMAAGAVKG